MNKFRKLFISVCILLPSIANTAPGGASGTIYSVIIKETGYLLITLDSAHANPTGCLQNKMIAIANNHIAKKEMLSLVLTAQAQQKPVSFWVTDCYEYYGTSYPLAVTAGIHRY